MELMLSYHDINHHDSTFLIHDTTQYIRDVCPTNITSDLQITINMTDNNPYATARLYVDLIITDLEGTNRPPTVEEDVESVFDIYFTMYNREIIYKISLGD